MMKLKLQYFGPPDAKNQLTGKDTDANKLENLIEMCKFLETTNLPD